MPSNRCRLVLNCPAVGEDDSWLLNAIESSDVAAIIFNQAIEPDLLEKIQQKDIACLLDGDPALAKELGFDGVHLDDGIEEMAKARKILGDNAQIGANAGKTRDQAMRIGESGVDYIGLPADCEMISWWSDLFVIPCIAMGNVTLENAPSLIEAGADFLAPGKAIWEHEGGARAAMAAFNNLMDEAVKS